MNANMTELSKKPDHETENHTDNGAEAAPKPALRGWYVYVALLILVFFTALFLLELLVLNPGSAHTDLPTEAEYEARVAALLVDAEPVNGDQLIETYQCAACHRLGVVNGIAPSFVGIADRADERATELAAEREPPLSAATYIYESIIKPQAHEVEGYSGVMPVNYADRLTDREMGDLLAYLLSDDAQ